MRQPEYNGAWPRWSMTMLLLVINLIVFILVEITKGYSPGGFGSILQYFALSIGGVAHGYIWQFLTFQFLHLGRMHFVFNMLGLFFLGRMVENAMGGKRFLMLYLASGFMGGVFQTVLGLIFPNVFGLPVVGASAGVFGLLAALAALEPNVEMLVFFILPVKIKYLAWTAAIVAVFYIIVPAEPGIAHAAHLGGMVMGFFFVRVILQGDWARLKGAFRSSEKSGSRDRPRIRIEKEPPKKSVADEVDPILDKISAKGIQSLTAHEREVLESARKKIGPR